MVWYDKMFPKIKLQRAPLITSREFGDLLCAILRVYSVLLELDKQPHGDILLPLANFVFSFSFKHLGKTSLEHTVRH